MLRLRRQRSARSGTGGNVSCDTGFGLSAWVDMGIARSSVERLAQGCIAGAGLPGPTPRLPRRSLLQLQLAQRQKHQELQGQRISPAAPA